MDQKKTVDERHNAFERIISITGWLAGGLTLVMMAAILREVVGGIFSTIPRTGLWSFADICWWPWLIWAHPYTELTEGNIRIDFIYGRFSGRVKALVDVFIYLAALCWTVIILWQGWRLARDSWEISARSSEAMAWPLFPSQILVPIGAFLVGLVLLMKMGRRIRKLLSSRGN